MGTNQKSQQLLCESMRNRLCCWTFVGLIPILLLLFFVRFTTAVRAEGQDPEQGIIGEIIPQQSKTGPVPPAVLVARDNQRSIVESELNGSEVLLTVPAYLWRHGCGPTALGMVLGYYDAHGYPDLIPGDASTQTIAVNQMIASGGTASSPMLPGFEGNFEDYASPVDYSPPLLTDAYITAGRSPHIDNSLADFMDTSKSTRSNYYGWSWSTDMGPSFIDYISLKNTAYTASYQSYYAYYSPAITWSIVKSEIDAGRPMVFLVDTNGDNGTDHFVTVIGYRTEPTLQYASWDTWSSTTIRWENFSLIGSGIPWSIWGAWSFHLQGSPQLDEALYLPFVRK